MSNRSFLESLKDRRVIRTTLLYIALLWVALQAADLLANADIVPDHAVRWLILLGAVGLPITMLVSWFYDAPWRERRWTSVGGDMLIIVAITAAAALFAWQQWFTSFTRPTLAVLKIESTDLREDSEQLGAHLSIRLRSALATRPEIRVIEPTTAFHDKLISLSIADKAALVDADFVIAGTVARLDSRLRLNVQLFGSDGELIVGSTFEERLLDQAQLQSRVLAAAWAHLPLAEDGLQSTRKLIESCAYPDSPEALLAIAQVDSSGTTIDVAELAASYPDAGMVQLASARQAFVDMYSAPATRKPVMQQVAMQYLDNARQLCPLTPDWELMRVANTQELVSDEMLHTHPNSALLLTKAARQNSDPERAEAFMKEARLLDPLGDW